MLLKLDQLRRTFGEVIALDDVTLTLPPGRIGLLGPNGAGKSTLLKILLGLIAPTSGHGRLLDLPLGEDRIALRRRIGFMPEAEALVPGLTGVEYVSLAGELCGLPRRQAQRRAHEVLGYLQLEEARYRRVEEYSLGMKQRVKLAQALVHDPPLLLLDEPTSGLDPAGRDALLRLVRELGTEHGKSIILSTHLLADVQTVCEYAVILAGGKVRGHGPVSELCATRNDRWRLRVDGNTEAYRRGLEEQNVEFLPEAGGDWRVRVPAAWHTSCFFQLAANHNAVVRAMTRDDETLEELFLRTVTPP